MQDRLSRARIATLAVALSVVPCSASAGEFIDTRVSFTLGDDNFLRNGGEQIPDSPEPGIGDRPGYQRPFDNMNSRTTGRENELHLVLYKRAEGILPRLTTEAAAALRIDMAALEGKRDVSEVFGDDSSYIRLTYALDFRRARDHYLDVVLFPLSGDRFRVGYLYDLTWGGKDAFTRRRGITPAFKLGGTHGPVYWWAGMKTVLTETGPERSTDEQGARSTISRPEMLYSVLGGAGVTPIEGLSIDLSGAYIQQARIGLEETLNQLVSSTGGSLRVAWGRGLKVGLSADLRLLRNDVEFLESLVRKPIYNPGSGLSYSISLEGTMIAQRLADPEHIGGMTLQLAPASAFDTRLQYGYARFNFTAAYRSVAFRLLNKPGLSYTAFSDAARIRDELFFVVAGDYHFPRFALTPGLQYGLEIPPAITTQLNEQFVGPNPPPQLTGEKTVLYTATGQQVIFPDNSGRVPIHSARLSLRWDPSEMLTMWAFLLLVYDQNTVTFQQNADLTQSLVFDQPIKFGAGITAQARF